MHVGDYLGDTGHLTTLEHGAYHLLLYHYWRNGPLADENKHLASIARMKLDHWIRIREIIQRFFVLQDGRWFHVRVQKEIAYAAEKRVRRERAGRLGGLEKARKISSNATILLEHSPSKHLASSSSSCIDSPIKVESSVPLESIQTSSLAHCDAMQPIAGQKYTKEFEEFWKLYPKREGTNDKFPASKKFNAARKSGVPQDSILMGLRRFIADLERRRHIGTSFVPQAETWLNKRGWEAYEPSATANGHAKKPPMTPEKAAIAKRMAEEGAKLFDEFGNLKPYFD